MAHSTERPRFDYLKMFVKYFVLTNFIIFKKINFLNHKKVKILYNFVYNLHLKKKKKETKKELAGKYASVQGASQYF